jgi:hypothetical protein
MDAVAASRDAAGMMRRTRSVMVWAILVVAGCPEEEMGNGSTLTAPTTTPSDDTGDGTTDDTNPTTNVTASATMGGSEEGSTAAPGSSGETTAPADTGDSSGDPNACDPVVPGDWNSCHDETGDVDTTLCNWMGDPDATGFIGCLVRTGKEDYNTCFISGCEDACDCFAPPTTGTAVVECAEILTDGGTGCHLNCGDGATCPDGMECLGETCFWPPAA